MERSLYQEICQGNRLRENLTALRQEIRDEGKRKRLAYEIGGDFTVFTGLLENEDPKVRKSAALILGEMECPDLVTPLYEAYEKEETLFVRSSYLKALAAYDCRELFAKLRERLAWLDRQQTLPEEEKHRREEAAALQKLLLGQEKQKKHRFTGFEERVEVILLTNRCQRDVTAALVEEKEAAERMALLAGGVRVLTSRLARLWEIRTWSEMLFTVPGMRYVSMEPKEAAAALAVPVQRLLNRLHEGKFPYRFRLDIRGRKRGAEEASKKGDLIRRLAAAIEMESKRELVNAPSEYELEIRLLETKNGQWVPLLKLFTLADRRFLYRSQVVATSIAPYNAALIMELARDWLKPHAQVLDPFCGVGTMLVERARLMPADPLYGVDIYEEAVQKARENAELAGLPIHYINRDIRDFTHEYLFDEVISDMPGTGKTRDKGQILELYESFLNRIPVLLKKNGVLVLYTGEPDILKWCMEAHSGLFPEKEVELNEKNGSSLFVIRYTGE
ncbi:MAG TPA: methyltransferase domain-containing protein [Candidatus Limivivens intestinipullorum]|uniref:Methyltransferase domain-containing protein n=1 Tax=Candidatus Limivivens intestinipullorum TaxID=2840858 RepID=A0A9D1JJP4_9FIRM|nr:methyltransferase domain-containing protein [Candidatus Limivivens intestinipullorum]